MSFVKVVLTGLSALVLSACSIMPSATRKWEEFVRNYEYRLEKQAEILSMDANIRSYAHGNLPNDPDNQEEYDAETRAAKRALRRVAQAGAKSVRDVITDRIGPLEISPDLYLEGNESATNEPEPPSSHEPSDRDYSLRVMPGLKRLRVGAQVDELKLRYTRTYDGDKQRLEAQLPLGPIKPSFTWTRHDKRDTYSLKATFWKHFYGSASVTDDSNTEAWLGFNLDH